MLRLLAVVMVLLLSQLPPGGTFVDDDGSVHEASIEAIHAAGLTNGCNPPASDHFCPRDYVTRGQMAAFLTRALSLKASSVDRFVDDQGSMFEGDINRLAAAGITKGCNPPANDRFCPDEWMSRGQMAVMLVRAFDYSHSGKNWFVDDNGNIFEEEINRLAAAGITKGCNPPADDRFCPLGVVTREQMAAFLVRALGLTPMQPPPTIGARYWADSSPFNRPIPANPALDSLSSGMVALLTGDVVFDLYEYGIAVYQVDGSTPRVNVYCTANWGTCPTDTLNPIPVPPGMRPPPGTDGNTVLVDWGNRRAISLHQPVKSGDGSWSATWVTVADLRGSGIPPAGGNGSGASHLAGVIELDEIQSGRIDHALVFSTDALCQGDLRYPARKTDGLSTLADCVPAGARVQLDPSIDLDKLGLSKGSLAVARALQDYGAYAVDHGGATMALYFQTAPDATSNNPGGVYRDAGIDKDYFRASKIPWQSLRVLSSWDGN